MPHFFPESAQEGRNGIGSEAANGPVCLLPFLSLSKGNGGVWLETISFQPFTDALTLIHRLTKREGRPADDANKSYEQNGQGY
jgi:hypothetical protein